MSEQTQLFLVKGLMIGYYIISLQHMLRWEYKNKTLNYGTFVFSLIMAPVLLPLLDMKSAGYRTRNNNEQPTNIEPQTNNIGRTNTNKEFKFLRGRC